VQQRKAAVAASELASALQRVGRLEEEAQQMARGHQLVVRDLEEEVDGLTERVHHLREKQVTTNRFHMVQRGEAKRLQAELDAAEEIIADQGRQLDAWHDSFSGLADQINDIVSRHRPGMAVEFIPKRDLSTHGLVAGGAGRNGGVTWGWVECKRRPTHTDCAGPQLSYYMPAVAKKFSPAENNELLMSLEADWAGGVRFYGIFEVEGEWKLVFEDAGMCLEDLLEGGPEVRGGLHQAPCIPA
jgi:hypothetical protein